MTVHSGSSQHGHAGDGVKSHSFPQKKERGSLRGQIPRLAVSLHSCPGCWTHGPHRNPGCCGHLCPPQWRTELCLKLGDPQPPSPHQIFTIWKKVAGQAAWLGSVIRLCRSVFPPGARAVWTPGHAHFSSMLLLAFCSPRT